MTRKPDQEGNMSEEILSDVKLDAIEKLYQYRSEGYAVAIYHLIASHRALAQERDALKVDLRAAQAGIVPAHCMLIRKEEYDALKRQVEELNKAIAVCSGSCSRVLKAELDQA